MYRGCKDLTIQQKEIFTVEINTNELAMKLWGGNENSPAKVGECKTVTGKFPQSTPIGMMYVPFQKWEEPYDPELAHSRGTMFPSLDLPFLGREASSNGSI